MFIRTLDLSLKNGNEGDKLEVLFVHLLFCDWLVAIHLDWVKDGKTRHYTYDTFIETREETFAFNCHYEFKCAVREMLLELGLIRCSEDDYIGWHEFINGDGKWMLDVDEEAFTIDKWTIVK